MQKEALPIPRNVVTILSSLKNLFLEIGRSQSESACGCLCEFRSKRHHGALESLSHGVGRRDGGRRIQKVWHSDFGVFFTKFRAFSMMTFV